jgi:hypothetical protein
LPASSRLKVRRDEFSRAGNCQQIRLDLVQRIRQAIADGVYETPEKWEKALQCLMDQVM